MKTPYSALFIASLLLVLPSCRHASPKTPPPAMLENTANDTALGPGDIFNVDVFGEKDLSGKFRISAKGTIDYPFAGTVKVEGKTPSEVAALLREKLADGYLKNPNVSVFVESFNSKKLSVFGAVKSPGTFKYSNNMSIIEAITLAGGFTPLAAKNDIQVTRKINGKSQKFTIAVEDIGVGQASNYRLNPGDVVFVPERMF